MSGRYLLLVATYIIDVNAHCWPFIKTPPYIRSTSVEDFIPPCSGRGLLLLLLLPSLVALLSSFVSGSLSRRPPRAHTDSSARSPPALERVIRFPRQKRTHRPLLSPLVAPISSPSFFPSCVRPFSTFVSSRINFLPSSLTPQRRFVASRQIPSLSWRSSPVSIHFFFTPVRSSPLSSLLPSLTPSQLPSLTEERLRSLELCARVNVNVIVIVSMRRRSRRRCRCDRRNGAREEKRRQTEETEEEVEVKKLPACALCSARLLVAR